MSVNPKEKAAFQEMWNQAAKSGGADIPDGTYQFTILSARFHMSDKGRPQFKSKVRVTGGAEDYVGKEFEINDNLETPENMGWFKRKLSRLNISLPEDFDEVTDGTLAEQMTGKVFEGQAKTKNDFLNVYVNRLIGEAPVSKHTDDEPVSEDTEAEESEEGEGFEEGQAVTWKGKRGEIVELTDDGKYRVKAEDGKVYRVDKAILQAVDVEDEAAEEQAAEEVDEINGDEGIALPTPEEAESLPAAEVKKVLKELGIEAGAVKNPRAVLHGVATLAADPKAKIELTEIAPLAAALNVTVKKGAPIKDVTKALSNAVQELVGSN